jgi:hypothetical protein
VETTHPSDSASLNLFFADGRARPPRRACRLPVTGRSPLPPARRFLERDPITGVTAGTDLTGGGATGNITLNLDTTKVPQLAASNTFTANQTVDGKVTATSFSGSGAGVTNVDASRTRRPGLQRLRPIGREQHFQRPTNRYDGNEHFRRIAGDQHRYLRPGSRHCRHYRQQRRRRDQGHCGGHLGDGGGRAWIHIQPGRVWSLRAKSERGCLWLREWVEHTGRHARAAGVWGDAGGDSAAGFAGVLGTADGNNAAFFVNNSQFETTLLVENQYGSDDTVTVFEAYGSGFYTGCYIDGAGDLVCTGTVSGVVPAGAQKVSVYATQSTENWLEDAGAGQLLNGSTRIDLDPTFAQTVNTGVAYHVFLTPKGDCKGLYVGGETAQGFEVHEMGGGHSNIAFDYRIMAKRNGFENVRLADVTKKYQEMEQQRKALRERTAQRRAQQAEPNR